MLTPEEVKHIHAEERLRNDIRQHIETATSPAVEEVSVKSNALMEFLNSSLGMWILSSVLLTGGAATYQQIQHGYQIHEQNHQLLVSHLFEIQNRVDNMEYLLRRANTVGDAKKALSGLFRSTFPIAPELQNRSLSSLYFSVYSLIPGTSQQKAQEAIEFVRQLEDSEYSLQSRPDTQILTAADRDQFNKLISACKSIHLDAQIKRTQ